MTSNVVCREIQARKECWAAWRGGGTAAEPTRRGGVIVREPHTANAITALCGTQTPPRPTRRSGREEQDGQSQETFIGRDAHQ